MTRSLGKVFRRIVADRRGGCRVDGATDEADIDADFRAEVVRRELRTAAVERRCAVELRSPRGD